MYSCSCILAYSGKKSDRIRNTHKVVLKERSYGKKKQNRMIRMIVSWSANIQLFHITESCFCNFLSFSMLEKNIPEPSWMRRGFQQSLIPSPVLQVQRYNSSNNSAVACMLCLPSGFSLTEHLPYPVSHMNPVPVSLGPELILFCIQAPFSPSIDFHLVYTLPVFSSE